MEDLSKFTNTYTCNNINNDYESFINHFIELLDKHTPLKKKKVRGNQSRFMSKELSKAIMKRSMLRSKYLKNRNNQNRIDYKKQRNLCVKLRKLAINNDFQKAASFANKIALLFIKLLSLT